MFSSNTSQVSGGYEIQRSLRFNSADSAYLNRTPASAGNRTTWTWSGWVKRSTLGSNQAFFAGNAAATDADYTAVSFGTDDTLSIGGWNTDWRKTTQVFRDVSAWYHIVIVWDTTQATAANRVKIYVNNVEATSFILNVNPSLNATSGVNTASPHYLSTYNSVNQFFPGYMTEVNFIDGQALTPSSFGAFDAQTGVWGPTPYAGSYGTNGFYLNFSDNSNTTAATLGKDYSGNGNNWTPNNFSVSAGAGNDSLVDVPTNWGTDTGVGGSVRGNYCTWNPLDKNASISTLNGNLDAYVASGSWFSVRATFGMSSGKWYWECTPNSSSALLIGIGTSQATLADYVGADAFGWSYFGTNGNKFNNNVSAAYGSTYTTNDVIGIAFDADIGTLTFYKNGTSQGTAYTGLTSGPYFPMVGIGGALTVVANFGQRPFAYTAPSGFKALNTQNLPTPTIGATTATQAGKFFNPVLWTGTGSTRNVTGVGFQPDAVWVKSRSNVRNHELYDVVRGIGTTSYGLFPNLTDAEAAATASRVSAVNSDGFEINGGAGNLNQLDYTYVAWNWKANGAGVTNTAGSITSTVSANTTSGFSVVTWTAGSGTQTIGHGLNAVPRMIITKNRSSSAGWWTYHASLGSTQYLALNTTAAAASVSWGGNPTSSVFTINDNFNTSGQNYVAYCFAEVPGYSKIGSYTGNGSTDGPFSFTGMRPAYLMIKRTDTTSNWTVLDFKRLGYNVDNNPLYPNLSDAEGTTDLADLLSNGFKLRSTDASVNASGGTYIFMALAEAPFKYSLGR